MWLLVLSATPVYNNPTEIVWLCKGEGWFPRRQSMEHSFPRLIPIIYFYSFGMVFCQLVARDVLFANLTPIQAASAVAKEDRHFQIPSITRPALSELISFGIDEFLSIIKLFRPLHTIHNCLVAVCSSRFLYNTFGRRETFGRWETDVAILVV